MTTNSIKALHPFPIADAQTRLRHVFIRDLVLSASIGVHKREHAAPQRIRVNVDLGVREGESPIDDDLSNVVCYEEIAAGIRSVVSARHVHLVETLAEEIAGVCLRDPRVRSARIRVEKLDIFPDAASVGVEIERTRTDLRGD
jgi:dihydroneopterin aldolase